MQRPWTMTLEPTTRALLSVFLALLLALFQPRSAFGTNNLGARWMEFPGGGYTYLIKWAFGPSFPSNATMRTAVADGRTAWNSVDRMLFFSWVSTGQRIHVYYDDLWFPYDDKLALASWAKNGIYLVSGEITFNNNISGGLRLNWGQQALTCPTEFDLRSVAAHEFGHLVQLEHTTYSADVMQDVLACGSTKRTLSSHDRSGITAMYPAH